MSISIVTPPAAEPISCAQLAQQMGFGTVADGTLEATLNAQLSTAIVGARGNIESWLRRALITQHWLLRRDGFPPHTLELPKPQFQSIDWFKYVDTARRMGTSLSAEVRRSPVPCFRHGRSPGRRRCVFRPRSWSSSAAGTVARQTFRWLLALRCWSVLHSTWMTHP
jgi:hypothetical protein